MHLQDIHTYRCFPCSTLFYILRYLIHHRRYPLHFINSFLYNYFECDFPMKPHVRRFVGGWFVVWLIGSLVLSFLSKKKFTHFRRSNRSVYWHACICRYVLHMYCQFSNAYIILSKATVWIMHIPLSVRPSLISSRPKSETEGFPGPGNSGLQCAGRPF